MCRNCRENFENTIPISSGLAVTWILICGLNTFTKRVLSSDMLGDELVISNVDDKNAISCFVCLGLLALFITYFCCKKASISINKCINFFSASCDCDKKSKQEETHSILKTKKSSAKPNESEDEDREFDFSVGLRSQDDYGVS
jgi:hypothetical protein